MVNLKITRTSNKKNLRIKLKIKKIKREEMKKKLSLFISIIVVKYVCTTPTFLVSGIISSHWQHLTSLLNIQMFKSSVDTHTHTNFLVKSAGP